MDINFDLGEDKIKVVKSLFEKFNKFLDQNRTEEIKKTDSLIEELSDLKFKDNRPYLNYDLMIDLIKRLIENKICFRLIKEKKNNTELINKLLVENKELISKLLVEKQNGISNQSLNYSSYQNNQQYDDLYDDSYNITSVTSLTSNRSLENLKREIFKSDKKSLIILTANLKPNINEYLESDVFWSKTNELIDLKFTYCLNEQLEDFIKNLKPKPDFKQSIKNLKPKPDFKESIKNLKISYYIDNIDLSFLNQFTSLEQLDIYFIYKQESDLELNLRNLKIIQIQHEKEINKKITIKSNKVEYLNCNNLNFVKINCKTELKYMELDVFDKEINKFKNLKTLEFEDCESLEQINLSKLNSLNKLSYVGGKSRILFSHFKEDESKMNNILDKSKEKFNKFLENKSNNINKIKLYYLGFKLNSKDDLNEIVDKLKICNKKNGNLFEAYYNYCKENYNNLSKLTDFQMVTKIDYGSLIKVFKGKPDELLELIKKSFKNIQIIMVSEKVIDQAYLIKFLGKCKNLIAIAFNETKLSSNFYDKLGEHTNELLSDLIIGEANLDNFSFIFKFPLLEHFETISSLKSENVKDILKKLKNIKSIFYRHSKNKNIRVRIYKLKIKSITLQFKNENQNLKTFEDLSLDKLIKEIENEENILVKKT